MILGLQISALVFSFAMIYFAVLHFKRRELSLREIVSWILIWVFVILAVLFPDILQTFARDFQFARLFDMMVVGGIMVAIYLSVKAYLGAKRVEKKIEELVRKEAFRGKRK